MNCFEWRNHSSDFLDGTMMPGERRDADKHLESCEDCRVRQQRFRQIVSVLGAQSRVPLPMQIRKAPLSFILPRLGAGFRSTRWERTPWLVRSSVEGLGVAFIVLAVIALVPKIRSLYERSLERSMDGYSLTDLTPDLKKSNSGVPPLARGKIQPEGTVAAPGTDEFASEGSEEDSAEDDGTVIQTEDPDVRVGSSEIWRFNLRTDSPHEVQPKVVQVLSALVSSQTSGLGGIEAPGGIQFDLLVPQGSIANIKKNLQKLASSEPAAQAGMPTSDFTWYKNKSKRPIPAGKARVVIWLSQI